MGRKAGIWIAGAAVAATAAVAAAAVFGAGAGSPTVKRAGALHLRARVERPVAAKAAAATHKPPVLYGATHPQVAPPMTSTVTLSGCPRRYHITNGTVAGVHGSQAQYLTINGSPRPGAAGRGRHRAPAPGRRPHRRGAGGSREGLRLAGREPRLPRNGAPNGADGRFVAAGRPDAPPLPRDQRLLLHPERAKDRGRVRG